MNCLERSKQYAIRKLRKMDNLSNTQQTYMERHRSFKKFGENIFHSSTAQLIVTATVFEWFLLACLSSYETKIHGWSNNHIASCGWQINLLQVDKTKLESVIDHRSRKWIHLTKNRFALQVPWEQKGELV